MQISGLPHTTADLKAREKKVQDLERKLKEEREEKERQDREKEREIAELRRQLDDSIQMSAGRGGATPNPQLRREEVIYNDIELLSSLSPATSACDT